MLPVDRVYAEGVQGYARGWRTAGVLGEAAAVGEFGADLEAFENPVDMGAVQVQARGRARLDLEPLQGAALGLPLARATGRKKVA